jgi:hypothetical protein
MNMGRAFLKSRVAIVCTTFAFIVNARAHRADDLLEACLIEVGRTEISVRLNLNPGVDVAGKLIWMADRNGDGEVSPEEARAYANGVLEKLAMSVDGRAVKLELGTVEFASTEEMKSGDGIVRLDLRTKLAKELVGTHTVRFENRNLPEMSAYLINAVQPSKKGVRILHQERSEDQRVGSIQFVLGPSGAR